MNGTGIMATVTAERCHREFLESLRSRGMSSVRINSAHVTPEVLERMCGEIRSAVPGVRILMDTKGPEIRTTACAVPIQLNEGDRVTLSGGTADSTAELISVNVDGLEDSVNEGMEILLDDGAIALHVESVREDMINTRVTRGGMLDARKTVSVPGARLPQLPAVSRRDAVNLDAAVRVGIDMVAHSFVRSAADVEAVRGHITGSGIELYAKIECREGVENMESILRAADGLLVARGDLGTQVSLWDIPAIQYRAIRECRRACKPSIVATQILQSMMHSSVPTRAEVCDIALAVMEGADTLLLCGETAVGEYPAECIDVMRRTIESVTRNNLRCKID